MTTPSTKNLTLPDSPHMDAPDPKGRLFAPSAARNMAPIVDLVSTYAPKRGKALEIASGTGEHCTALARALPQIHWQPTEPEAVRRASIDGHSEGISNMAPAIPLDAAAVDWSAQHGGQDLILLVNLLHLIPAPSAQTIITESARALNAGGHFIFYGPFLRGGQPTSDGDARFHASLRAQDPTIGYKDVEEIESWIAEAGLKLIARVDMPANNLAFVTKREHP
ncbi:DUF938 domain-containing protein [Thalassovita mediterranea]|jgi:SAM-dependent methyltransferase|uniref:Methyltransferase domain protein n=1 Tax=Thalassovita mediterranea TaxID=340021 RepID=A0A0P1H359_9RHOB|nr:DUF938 domain-containing protein [Thalassovita mediterranea]CUH84914.1 hypothetical protein TM5383_02133 [Thalassovita mediterranea]SIS29044.1 Protein of unknown function [Thalassovita mediterranea]